MIRDICKDELFLARKAAPALPEDLPIAQDLLETLIAHKDGCVGMAANMIGVNKRIIAVDCDGAYLLMLNPVILKQSGAGAEEVFVPLRRRVPALILHEAVVAAEVRRQRPSAMRAVRNKLCRHGHFGRFRRSKCAIRRNCIALRSDHVLDNLPVIERLRATRLAALEQPVVSLRVEQAVLVKSGFLKAVIHIRCQDKVILVLHKRKQFFIDGFWRIRITVDVNIAAPIGPVFFKR